MGGGRRFATALVVAAQLAFVLAQESAPQVHGHAGFDVTNVICVDAFKCSEKAGVPPCVAITASPLATDLQRHGVLLDEESRAQGVLPYDVEGLPKTLAQFLMSLRNQMKVKIVVGDAFSRAEAKVLKKAFGEHDGLGSKGDMPRRGAAHAKVLANLEAHALFLEAQGIGVEENRDFFDDVMHLYKREVDAREEAHVKKHRGDLRR